MQHDDRPLISIVTGTWQRRELVMEAIDNVRRQTYRPLEHVIVSDGPHEELALWINDNIQYSKVYDKNYVPIVFQELGFHASGFFHASESAAPFMVAQLLAHGPLQCWMADDERFEPEHLDKLYELMESTYSDFVYSLAKMYWKGNDPSSAYIIGADPPVSGQVTNALYRREVLDYAMMDLHVGSGTDWHQFSEWIKANARYAMLYEPTIIHRIDKRGEGGNYRPNRQPLRGQTEDTTIFVNDECVECKSMIYHYDPIDGKTCSKCKRKITSGV